MREVGTGDLSRSFQGGVMQQVDDGAKARDGRVWLFLSEDWGDIGPRVGPPDFEVSRNVKIPVHCEVIGQLLKCSCVVVLEGMQCGQLHLALVAHCRDWLWTITDRSISQREVEGSGTVDYLNLIWAISSTFRLYRNVTNNVGLAEYPAFDGSRCGARHGRVAAARSDA